MPAGWQSPQRTCTVSEVTILVIDDMRSFDDLDQYRNVSFTYARTSDEGIRLLERERFDGLWLDYNLGWENADVTDNGLRVAEWLQPRHARFADLQITIITDSDAKAIVIADALRGGGYRPQISDIGREWDARHT